MLLWYHFGEEITIMSRQEECVKITKAALLCKRAAKGSLQGGCGSRGACGWPRGSRPFSLPCQREVARPQAVTEGLPCGGLPLEKAEVCGEAIPRSPLSPPLTRGPVGVCAATGSGGMRASRPTFARAAAAAPIGRAFAVVCRGGPWPSRGRSRHSKVPGRDESRPYAQPIRPLQTWRAATGPTVAQSIQNVSCLGKTQLLD